VNKGPGSRWADMPIEATLAEFVVEGAPVNAPRRCIHPD
jgi:hypothetical protein